PLGSFLVEGLPPKPAGALQIEVHFDFDLNGILTVTATEKGEGQKNSFVVNNAETGRLSSHDLDQSREAVASLFDRLAFSPMEMDGEEDLPD
ncbi:MAG: Hsp70 family protein, partial [Phormidesmis sp.]